MSTDLLEASDARLAEVAARYAVAITPAMAALIDPSDPADPIARQFAPDARELDHRSEESADPIADHPWSPVEGLVHRYPDRVLLKVAHACAVYCRFCFRREMVGPGGPAPLTGERLAAALAYIAGQPGVWEVILSGGDPFILSNRRIGALSQALGAIAHVKVLRWHTRVPVVDPARVTGALAAALKVAGAASWVAVHANHPRELTEEARAAIGRLVDGGLPVVSQTVLLKGVNDDPDVLEALMRAFVEARVKPYYLHHGDLAPGTSHFRTTIAQGQALAAGLRARASGLCQPSYVLDAPGAAFKAPLAACHVVLEEAEDGAERARILGADGVWRAYPPGGGGSGG